MPRPIMDADPIPGFLRNVVKKGRVLMAGGAALGATTVLLPDVVHGQTPDKQPHVITLQQSPLDSKGETRGVEIDSPEVTAPSSLLWAIDTAQPRPSTNELIEADKVVVSLLRNMRDKHPEFTRVVSSFVKKNEKGKEEQLENFVIKVNIFRDGAPATKPELKNKLFTAGIGPSSAKPGQLDFNLHYHPDQVTRFPSESQEAQIQFYATWLFLEEGMKIARASADISAADAAIKTKESDIGNEVAGKAMIVLQQLGSSVKPESENPSTYQDTFSNNDTDTEKPVEPSNDSAEANKPAEPVEPTP